MPVSKFLFGTGLENEIRVGFPLFDIITDREDGEGSEYIDVPDGSVDTWRQNKMYTIDTEVRWIPDGPGMAPVQTQLSGPVSWEEFIDWARDGRAFRFQPDENVPGFYVDNTYLVEPRKGFGSLSTDIKRNVRLKLRNPAKSFHEALRGIMFEYATGSDTARSLTPTYARNAAAKYLDSTGVVQAAVANELRDRHYESGRRVTLIEDGRTNLLLRSEELDNAAWTKNAVTISANALTAPDGVSSADRVVETAVSASHTVLQAITITAGRVVVAQGFFHAQERTQGRALVWNGADSFGLDFDTAAGGSSATFVGGTGSIKASRFVAIGGGWWHFWVSGIVSAGATAINTEWALRAGGLTSYLGDITKGASFWGLHAEQVAVSGTITQPAPAFYIPTAGATVTLPPDSLVWAWPWAPQSQWLYIKLLNDANTLASFSGGLSIGSAPVGRMVIYLGGGQVLGGIDNAGVAKSSVVSPTMATGDEIEALLVVFPDMSVRIFASVNGAADVAGGASTSSGSTPAAFGVAQLLMDQALNAPAGLSYLRRVKIGVGSSVLSLAAARAA